MVATGITVHGHREVLGGEIGDSEDETFWTRFLRSLRGRGLRGVRLVISAGPFAARQPMSGTTKTRRSMPACRQRGRGAVCSCDLGYLRSPSTPSDRQAVGLLREGADSPQGATASGGRGSS